MQSKRESKVDVRFPVDVLASIWQQLKTEVVKNCFSKAGFERDINEAASEESSIPDEPSGPSVWPQVREAFRAESFSDFVTFNNCVSNNKQLTDEDLRATIEGRSELSSDDSDQESQTDVFGHIVLQASFGAARTTACPAHRTTSPSRMARPTTQMPAPVKQPLVTNEPAAPAQDKVIVSASS
ncbi:hypothetical protein HPB50_019207 [Hyalomma asiaticum]|uniref:Uncharacterized protein n=1 Tax=Hyalomma asiaticum TaxID=266040 RepID=A0ACB7SVA2_HYAAI|nr:hypothetical protein HPB50_019207 [Hyalomma asiaticum]